MSDTPPKKNEGRFTVSVSVVVARWARELCRKKGYDNFSAYIADLIRRDKERQETKEGIYPAHIEQFDLVAEKPSTAPEEDKGRKKAKGR